MRKTIALVDDDRNILTSVSMMLEAEGYAVTTYRDGAEALRGLQTEAADLAVLDIKMPRMDGIELLQRLREKSAMPVIFLTSAIVSGISVLVLLYLFLCRRSGVEPDDACMRALAQLLWRFLILAVVFEAIDLLHVAYEREEEWHVIRELLATKLRFSWLVLQVVVDPLHDRAGQEPLAQLGEVGGVERLRAA
mgnify:CR=1 FL=1